MVDELKDSGTVTAISVVGLVFGLIGMLGSFIPCIGSLAFYIGIPAAIASGIALGIAYSQNAKKTFAIVALTISLIGVVISGIQYYSIISAGNQAKKDIEKWSRPSTSASMPAQAPRIEPAPSSTKVPALEPQVNYIKKEKDKNNSEEARKIFFTTYVKLFNRNNYDEMSSLKNNNDWVLKEVNLTKGAKNFLKVEGSKYGMFVVFVNKTKIPVLSDLGCREQYKPLNPKSSNRIHIWTADDEKNVCCQFYFEPFYNDEKLELLLPAPFAQDYKIILQDAEILK